MDINDFHKEMLRIFYERTNYDKINITINTCDDIYECALNYSPCQKHKSMLIEHKEIITHFNGISFPKEKLEDGYYAIISKNVFNKKNNTYLGTYQHEITHAHDFAVMAKYIGAKYAKDIYASEFYGDAMGTISEFNARRNGFSYLRELSYRFADIEEERNHVLSREVPFIINNTKDADNFDNLSQLFGRMAVLDSKTEERARYQFYEYLATVFNQYSFDRVIKIYEILYKYKDVKNNIFLCLPEITPITKELFG